MPRVCVNTFDPEKLTKLQLEIVKLAGLGKAEEALDFIAEAKPPASRTFGRARVVVADDRICVEEASAGSNGGLL